MPGDIHLVRDHRAVQALVEQQVGLGWNVLPLGECPGFLLVAGSFHVIVQIFAQAATAGRAIAAEQLLQLNEQIGIGPEVAEFMIATGDGVRQALFHFRTVVAMKAVAFDKRGVHLLAAEDLLERLADGGRSGARGAGHGNDGMSGRHGSPQAYVVLKRPRVPNRGASNSNSLWSRWYRSIRSTSSRAPNTKPMRS